MKIYTRETLIIHKENVYLHHSDPKYFLYMTFSEKVQSLKDIKI